MRKNISGVVLTILIPVLILSFMIGSMHSSLRHMGKDVAAEDRQQLENAIRRAAVACYAAEGFYPPDMDYITQHYGVQADTQRYHVFYEIFAENIMPQIIVTGRGSFMDSP